jgi:hypothetical protein
MRPGAVTIPVTSDVLGLQVQTVAQLAACNAARPTLFL